ncbi:molybdenum cofactor biosynthesis protein A [Helicobacter pylori Hp M2]|uniref:Molybdenum cofactor biosynthesis protein A n=2 Tax=Helicobacter pylori TaxID=210 RepID=I9RY87_HELPX|nr:molybdenum cofactor biosynthesis protein A [Helicobacter pylori Hp H-24]EJC18158.1 molybdenum cofactor biosynthesis protein A [Helicobacter pylori Hp H-24b]EJC21302.1 molybdenum cofactor biosynthesis protein A [Helicobacter pylori Hp H-24c]EJC41804.1 molybdenum cofactor biosynthesis protein A [Helicobacter pylori Hp M2]EJC43359.1 molybdenum cofactor biosynthesis protein A [Helicobacter pylori Hp M4]EJC44500.1 molybdenum cofactor biosynthesis protein A [Helicobacter pylori Hp M3]EJC46582.1 
MPTTPLDFFDDEELLPLDSVLEFLKIAIDEGVKKIRITGGEPLLRKGLDEFIAKLHAYNKEVALVLSTNGFLLKKMAKGLKDAGLSRVNVSLDSLKSDRVLKISQKDALKNALEGIEESLKVGLKLKLNMVVMKGVNDDEILELLEYAKNRGIQIRYIEFMENTHAKDLVKGLKEREILDLIAQKYKIMGMEKPKQGSSKIYTLENGYQFGIIAPHSDDFCQSCNRIRLASDGKICPCLYYQDAIDAKEAIINKDTKMMKRLLKQSIINKPEKNMWNDKNSKTPTRAFYYTGG